MSAIGTIQCSVINIPSVFSPLLTHIFSSSHSGAEGLMDQARECEGRGEYTQAIAWYCKVSAEITNDTRYVINCYTPMGD